MLLNIQVPSPSHDDDRWLVIPKEIRDVRTSTFLQLAQHLC
jgi:hypothetical protein